MLLYKWNYIQYFKVSCFLYFSWDMRGYENLVPVIQNHIFLLKRTCFDLLVVYKENIKASLQVQTWQQSHLVFLSSILPYPNLNMSMLNFLWSTAHCIYRRCDFLISLEEILSVLTKGNCCWLTSVIIRLLLATFIPATQICHWDILSSSLFSLSFLAPVVWSETFIGYLFRRCNDIN